LTLADDVIVSGKLVIEQQNEVLIQSKNLAIPFKVELASTGTLKVNHISSTIILDESVLDCAVGIVENGGVILTINGGLVSQGSNSYTIINITGTMFTFDGKMKTVNGYNIQIDNGVLNSSTGLSGIISAVDVGRYEVMLGEIRYTPSGSSISTFRQNLTFYWTIVENPRILISGYESDKSDAESALTAVGVALPSPSDVADETMYVVYSQSMLTAKTITGEVYFINGSDDKLVSIFTEPLGNEDNMRKAWYFSFDVGEEAEDWTPINGDYLIRILIDGTVAATTIVTIDSISTQFIEEKGAGYNEYGVGTQSDFTSLGIEYIDSFKDETMHLVYVQNGYASMNMRGEAYYLNSSGDEVFVYGESFVSQDGVGVWFFSFDDNGEAASWFPLDGTYYLRLIDDDSDTLMLESIVTVATGSVFIEEIDSGYFADSADVYDAFSAIGIDYISGILNETMYVAYAQNGYVSIDMRGEAYYVNSNGMEIPIYADLFVSPDGVMIWYFSFDDFGTANLWTPLAGTYEIRLYDDNTGDLMLSTSIDIVDDSKLMEMVDVGYYEDSSDVLNALDSHGITYISDVASNTMYLLYRQNGYSSTEMYGKLYYDNTESYLQLFGETLISDNGVRVWYFSFANGGQVGSWDLTSGDYTLELYSDDVIVLSTTISPTFPQHMVIKGAGYDVDADDVNLAIESLGRGDIVVTEDRTVYVVYSQNGYGSSQMSGNLYFGNYMIYSEILPSYDGLREWHFSFDNEIQDWPFINGTYAIEICADGVVVGYVTFFVSDGTDWSFVDFYGNGDSTFNMDLMFSSSINNGYSAGVLLESVDANVDLYYINGYNGYDGYYFDFIVMPNYLGVDWNKVDLSITDLAGNSMPFDFSNGSILLGLGAVVPSAFKILIDLDGNETAYSPVEYTIDIAYSPGSVYEIVYVYHDNSEYRITAMVGSDVLLPTPKKLEGFDGWENNGNMYLVNQYYNVASDQGRLIYFYASYGGMYDVVLMDDNNIVKTYTAMKGDALSLPTMPSTGDLKFVGWAVEVLLDDGTSVAGIPIVGQYIVSIVDIQVNGEIVLRSCYELDPYIVITYGNANNGSVFGNTSVMSGNYVFIVVNADPSYSLSKLSVIDSNGASVGYSMLMPGSLYMVLAGNDDLEVDVEFTYVGLSFRVSLEEVGTGVQAYVDGSNIPAGSSVSIKYTCMQHVYDSFIGGYVWEVSYVTETVVASNTHFFGIIPQGVDLVDACLTYEVGGETYQVWSATMKYIG